MPHELNIATLTCHPYCLAIPEMSDAEYQDLKGDISGSGQLEPIVLFGGQILDGRHRYRACVELGIEPHFKDFDGPDSVMDYVISANLRHRHLSESQRAQAMASLISLIQNKPVSANTTYEDSVKEFAIQNAICNQLNTGGIDYKKQVRFPLGIADIVVYETCTLIEIKAVLNRRSIFSAIGQLLVYKSCIENHQNWQITIAWMYHPDIDLMRSNLEQLGISVIIYSQGEVAAWCQDLPENKRQTARVSRRDNAIVS